MAHNPIFVVDDLSAEFKTHRGTVHAVNGISYQVNRGEILSIVGESGSGKSAGVLSALGLIPTGALVQGRVLFQGTDLLQAEDRALRRYRGSDIGLVLQNPMSSLNPAMTIGNQIAEAIRTHDKTYSRHSLNRRVRELLSFVGITNTQSRVKQYPHEFSGGMCQRVGIAMAIANEPKLLVADEPTTALDVTVQAQVMDALHKAKNETGAATILITHDLGLVAEHADRGAVMYGGQIIESGAVNDLFSRPQHPYTLGLMSSVPRLKEQLPRLSPIPGQPPNLLSPPQGCVFEPRCRLSRGRIECSTVTPPLETKYGTEHEAACHFSDEMPDLIRELSSELGRDPTTASSGSPLEKPAEETGRTSKLQAHDVLLTVEDCVKVFESPRRAFGQAKEPLRAVDGVSLTIRSGEALGLVGESGSGKSTLARCILKLIEPTSGKIVFDGIDLTTFSRQNMRPLREDMQILFQDPYNSLNPRMRIRDIIAEPLRIHRDLNRSQIHTQVDELMAMVGLPLRSGDRGPQQFSGGQRQRVGLARALALNPRLLILDEPVSSLDVSIQAQILNLLQELQERLSLAYLFISHDLSVVSHISHRIAVMRYGKIVESGDRYELLGNPSHPYTRELISAVPEVHSKATG